MNLLFFFIEKNIKIIYILLKKKKFKIMMIWDLKILKSNKKNQAEPCEPAKCSQLETWYCNNSIENKK